MNKFKEILEELIFEMGNPSLSEIERLSGIKQSQFSRYLMGAYPYINSAINLANFFDVSVDYLFGISTDKSHSGYGAKNLTVFLERYDKALKDNNYTNWQFCKKFNLSESNWRHWKMGQEPKLETLIIIAEKLNVSIDYLIGRF